MRISNRPAILTGLVILLGGCLGQDATPTPQPTLMPSVAPSVQGNPPASQPAASAPTSAAPGSTAPSQDLGPFSCDLPIHLDATIAITNIVDVRHGTYDDYDRVVFEFASGLPEVFIERAAPPFTHDASGIPMTVDGTSFLRITLRGGTKATSSGEASYTGPTAFEPGYPTLVHLIEGGDFEAQSTWYAGLASEACLRPMVLVGEGGGTRLVIDIGR